MTKKAKEKKSLWRRLARGAGWATLGFAAVAIPLHMFLRRELAGAPPQVQAAGWPIRLMQAMFYRYIVRWIDVEGLENLPVGPYVLAANHAYKSGVDGYILGHLLVSQCGCVPRILITADSRNWAVQIQRWVLTYYGIALLVPDKDTGGPPRRTSDIIADYLRAGDRNAVLIFPAGRAVADPAKQLEGWSTGAVVAARKAGCPVVPAAIGGMKLDWTPETVIFAAMGEQDRADSDPPFRMHVRIGKPLWPQADAQAATEELREAVAGLMQEIPGLRPAPGESDEHFGKMTLRDGRTLAYMDRGPRDGIPIFHFHSLQGSRIERLATNEAMLERLGVRLITPDRPGIGLSTPQRGRTLASWASDVRELAAHLLGDGGQFSILGFSAGATYALACGQLPGLRAVSLVGGLGLPHLISVWRRYSNEAIKILLSAKMAKVREATFLSIEARHRKRLTVDLEGYIEQVKRGLSPDDRRILSQPEVEELFRQNRWESYAQGPGYLLQEVQALYSDPDIDLDRLAACTVLITHGGQDQVVPPAVARDLHERIPGSGYHELPRRGHYFLYEPREMERILAELARAHIECPE
jgi:pimeloyl-ACP methyl ester carboxylesterase/1-acyl-sn-glycerol-3-phosphate acyltransferase